MTGIIYKAELLRYFKSLNVLSFSLIVPAILTIMIRPTSQDTSSGDLLFNSLLTLHLPSVVDALFLSRSFLSKGFLIQTKTLGRKVSLATVFFILTVSSLRILIISVIEVILSAGSLIVNILILSLVSAVYASLFNSVSFLGCDWLTITSGITLTFTVFLNYVNPSAFSQFDTLTKSNGFLYISILIDMLLWLSIYLLIVKKTRHGQRVTSHCLKL